MFENRMLRSIFGPKRRRQVRLHNVELHNLYFLLHVDVVGVMKSSRIRLTVHVARMES
jgi:hypothetical protein